MHHALEWASLAVAWEQPIGLSRLVFMPLLQIGRRDSVMQVIGLELAAFRSKPRF
jgi:hypothetical protein